MGRQEESHATAIIVLTVGELVKINSFSGLLYMLFSKKSMVVLGARSLGVSVANSASALGIDCLAVVLCERVGPFLIALARSTS